MPTDGLGRPGWPVLLAQRSFSVSCNIGSQNRKKKCKLELVFKVQKMAQYASFCHIMCPFKWEVFAAFWPVRPPYRALGCHLTLVGLAICLAHRSNESEHVEFWGLYEQYITSTFYFLVTCWEKVKIFKLEYLENLLSEFQEVFCNCCPWPGWPGVSISPAPQFGEG